MKKSYYFALLLIACSSINAQVYSYVDKNGRTIYTDNPPKGQLVRKLDVGTKPINKLNQNESADTTKTVRLSPKGKKTTPFHYDLLRVTLPEPDTVVANTGGVMTVSIETSPNILSDHHYRFLVDGETVLESPNKTVVQLENLERGEHQLSVAIVDNEENIIEQTPSQPFHIRQTTMSDRRRIKPCKIKEYGIRAECPIEKKPNCKLKDYGVKPECPADQKPVCGALDFGVKPDCPSDEAPIVRKITNSLGITSP